MQTLTYGYQKPEDGDRSTTWFPALASNVQKLNDHTHDGVNSSQVNPAGLDKTNFSQSFAAGDSGGWIADGAYPGNYYKDISVPAGVLEINDYFVKLIDSSVNSVLSLSWERIDAQSYRVHSNDNTLALLIKYL